MAIDELSEVLIDSHHGLHERVRSKVKVTF